MVIMAREQKWLVDHYDEVEQYTGKWVVILNNRVIAAGKTAKAALKRAKSKGVKGTPLVTKILPKDEKVHVL